MKGQGTLQRRRSRAVARRATYQNDRHKSTAASRTRGDRSKTQDDRSKGPANRPSTTAQPRATSWERQNNASRTHRTRGHPDCTSRPTAPAMRTRGMHAEQRLPRALYDGQHSCATQESSRIVEAQLISDSGTLVGTLIEHRARRASELQPGTASTQPSRDNRRTPSSICRLRISSPPHGTTRTWCEDTLHRSEHDRDTPDTPRTHGHALRVTGRPP